jgi:uncharacterized protein related to proFAR isomerase
MELVISGFICHNFDHGEMKRLENNAELYRYLLLLVSQLRDRGASDLATLVESANRQASGMSTEFLGESRIALRQLLVKEKDILTEAERKDILDILKQLDEALDRRQPN